MEDRYLFKGKRVDNGEWEIGSLIILPNGKYEIANSCTNPPDSDPMWKSCVITHLVGPSTICQCTGLKDKNGKLVWENNILNLDEGINAGCFWDEVNAEWGLRTPTRTISLCSYSLAELAVIGNIFDNAELLESEG